MVRPPTPSDARGTIARRWSDSRSHNETGLLAPGLHPAHLVFALIALAAGGEQWCRSSQK